ncbi:MAG: hypothetical protein WCV79_03720 [Candidatus Paceibacterota bacterium]
MKTISLLVLSVVLMAGIVSAATTISTNISTEGQLSVTSTSTFMGNVGIGTTTPVNKLTIYGSNSSTGSFVGIDQLGDNAQPYLYMKEYATSASGPFLRFHLGRGTSQDTAAVSQNNDRFGLVIGGGYSAAASNFINGAGIYFHIDGEVDTAGDTTDMPGRLSFWTTPDGSGTITERMRISSAGNVGIGTTTPATRLHISSGASATTTVSIGELGLTSSKSCVNMNRSDGTAASFFINPAGTMVVETNYCR